ncbi:MAG: alpha/beta hydrolase, partial [Ignavibacteriae bacterium]|nr:alpha/beta hydrolase [Ignavibacteriota bacterium]
IEKALKELTKPYLILHGDQDLAVPFVEANQIYEWSNKSTTKLEFIKGTGHTFDIKHPFDGNTKAFDILLSKTLEFFNSTFTNK